VFENFVKLLEELWTEDPIYEGTNKFINLKKYLIYLSKTKLIQLKKLNEIPGWTITEPLRNYFDKLYNQFGISPSNILGPVYYSETQYSTLENKEILILKNILKSGEIYGSSFIKKLDEIIISYDKVIKIVNSFNLNHIKSDYLFELVTISFENLITILVIQCDKEIDEYESALNVFEKSWYEILEVTYFAKNLKDFKEIGRLSKDQILVLLREYLKVMKLLIRKLRRFIQWDQIFSLKNMELWNSNKMILNDIRRNIFNNNFDTALPRIRGLIKSNLVSFIKIYSVLLFGQNKWKRAIPVHLNMKLKKIMKISTEKSIDFDNLHIFNTTDLFQIITQIREKTEMRISFINDLYILCISIYKKIIIDKQWDENLLLLIKMLDNFNRNLILNNIPYPFNSIQFLSVDNIFDIESKTELEIKEEQILFPFELDLNLLPLSLRKIQFKILDLILWIHSNKQNLEIVTDFKNEKFVIKKVGKLDFESIPKFAERQIHEKDSHLVNFDEYRRKIIENLKNHQKEYESFIKKNQDNIKFQKKTRSKFYKKKKKARKRK
jgi:hypothetical protein